MKRAKIKEIECITRSPRKPARHAPEAKPMADGRERCGRATDNG
jgi:hypothetical protein